MRLRAEQVDGHLQRNLAPVYLVHGYGEPKNCATGWRPAITTWRNDGDWTGTAHTVAYYAGDRG